jgi:regulator of protease activity HflC (stomatin/prohibitin superfamily)
MAIEAGAVRDANAQLIEAQGEKKVSVRLLRAANVLEQNPVAIQLRFLQTLSHIASENSSTIVFPLPFGHP